MLVDRRDRASGPGILETGSFPAREGCHPAGELYIAGDKDAQVLGSKAGWRENDRSKTLWGGDGFN
ncbi:MAG: hypothetical protein CMJ99_07480 [Planctomycetes bacterium]|nr:hypothetical protein [Planctomycetota bacterium]